MERLELSKQKSLGPKSSASTNFATSANRIEFLKNLDLSTFYSTCKKVLLANKSLNKFKDLFVIKIYAIYKTSLLSS